jgi:outer membrane lipoprotein-sorting protein
MRNLFLILVTAMAACAAAGQAAPAPADLENILTRVEQAQAENRAHFQPYVVTRQYRLYKKEGDQATSEVIADITFQPPDQKKYQIRRSHGSGSGEKVVRRVLEREAEMTRDPGQIEISRSNYDFALLRTEQLGGIPVYVLELKPKRCDKNLLKGLAYVDANTHLIRRLVGHPAKNPSWLIKDLQLTLTFAAVHGMWMQTASEAVANVRFVGKHVFTSQDMSVRTVQQVAQARPVPRRPRARAAASTIGAGVLR